MSAPYTSADRARDTSTTTGSGNFTLANSPPTGMQSLNSAVGTNVSFTYTIQLQSGSEWEVGIGYLSASTTLVRDTVTASSNSGSVVTFSAGTKDVWIDFGAWQAAQLATAGAMMQISRGNFLP